MDYELREDDPGLTGIADALDNNEPLLHYDTDKDGTLTAVSATYENGVGNRVEYTDSGYEHTRIVAGDSPAADDWEHNMQTASTWINCATAAYNTVLQAINTVPGVDTDRQPQDLIPDDLFDLSDVDYVVSTGGAEPVEDAARGSVDADQLYANLDDMFQTGCKTGDCGNLYFVQDGEIEPFRGEFVPKELEPLTA